MGSHSTGLRNPHGGTPALASQRRPFCRLCAQVPGCQRR